MPPRRLLVLLLPLLEVAGFVVAGQAVGVLGVVLLVAGAALAGGLLLRREGREAPDAVRAALRRGASPAPLLLRGGVRLVAALLLIVPGFLSDLAALALLLPPVQRALLRRLARGMPAGAPRQPAPAPAGVIIDAEWEEVPPVRPGARPGGSGWTRP